MARFTHPAIFEGGMSGLNIPHGAFHSDTDQTLAVNTPGSMHFEITDFSQGVTIVNDEFGHPSIIRIEEIGIYNISFSAQLHNTGGGGAGSTVDIWMVHQGSAVPDSNTKIEVPSNAPYVVAAWNFFVNSTTTPQDFQLFWKTPKAEIRLEHVDANGVIPSTPSIILTVNRVA